MSEPLVDALDAAADRPVIQIERGSLPECFEQAERALAAAGSTYQRGPHLVRVTRLEDPGEAHGVRRPAGALAVLPLEVDYARLALAEAASWQRRNARSEAFVPADPPTTVARTLLAAAGRWSTIPALQGISEAPTLRADGSLLDTPGYDPVSKLYFDPNGVSFPTIPSAPTRDDAEGALALLLDVVKDFPFSDEAGCAVAISAILTALVRRTLRSAPMFVFTAPTMGSGRTLLATIVGYIATGRPPAMMSQTDDVESERKRILALLIEGHAVCVLDNIERPLRSDTLCSILTEPVFSDRMLGATRMANVPTNTTWLATGNNLVVAGDLSTRVLVCELDPKCERPEERTFAVDLHRAVPTRRGELVAAALTIVRAYLAAGSPPHDQPPFGRFEAWARWARDPLIWLGLADPCTSRSKVEARDPVREQLAALTSAWLAVFGDKPAIVTEAATKAAEPGEANARLSRAMHDIASERGVLNARRIGKFIAKHERRVEGGLRFEKGEERRGVCTWRVVGLVGFAGLPPTPTRVSPAKIIGQ